jgi:sterol desaturase/sphingolipid hydroxylase (fatty acid hydroxylase superfamily)
MGEGLLTLLIGIAVPVVMIVLKRRSERNPDPWERVFGDVLSMLLAVGGVALIIFPLANFPGDAEAHAGFLGVVATLGFLVLGGIAVILCFFTVIFAIATWEDFERAD